MIKTITRELLDRVHMIHEADGYYLLIRNDILKLDYPGYALGEPLNCSWGHDHDTHYNYKSKQLDDDEQIAYQQYLEIIKLI